jgi:hypothetical protein
MQPRTFGRLVIKKKQQTETAKDKYIMVMTMNAQADRAERKEQARIEAKRHEELMTTLQMTVLQIYFT